ncbi:hypothetical protein FD28_GL001500 [Levilactobacillus hammesii DSM 16381]|uniref:Tat pathway signal sequence domain protein n=2 Tax=Levilactobacillus hammesii TaxID=267633 RepID=A0A0R1UIF1_9LACO|nr:hypothetical protein FD28_GL001500 [Levilactobacillus hammesii DSM 16381]
MTNGKGENLMDLRKVGLTCATGLTLGLAMVFTPAPAQAAKTLPGMAYTHTTPAKARGTWYTHTVVVGGYYKTVVKPHAVTWYYKAKHAGKWQKERQLKNQYLYVYRYNLKMTTTTLHMFGFYGANQKKGNFHFLSTRSIKGKSVRVMVDDNGSVNYHAWKNVK